MLTVFEALNLLWKMCIFFIANCCIVYFNKQKDGVSGTSRIDLNLFTACLIWENPKHHPAYTEYITADICSHIKLK